MFWWSHLDSNQEPSPYKEPALPLSYTTIWRIGWDSNPRITVLQTAPLSHLGTYPMSGTACRARTHNLIVRSDML